jgi:hypothetical protein
VTGWKHACASTVLGARSTQLPHAFGQRGLGDCRVAAQRRQPARPANEELVVRERVGFGGLGDLGVGRVLVAGHQPRLSRARTARSGWYLRARPASSTDRAQSALVSAAVAARSPSRPVGGVPAAAGAPSGGPPRQVGGTGSLARPRAISGDPGRVRRGRPSVRPP